MAKKTASKSPPAPSETSAAATRFANSLGALVMAELRHALRVARGEPAPAPRRARAVVPPPRKAPARKTAASKPPRTSAQKAAAIKPCIAPGCTSPSKGPRFHYLCDEHKGASPAEYAAWREGAYLAPPEEIPAAAAFLAPEDPAIQDPAPLV